MKFIHGPQIKNLNKTNYIYKSVILKKPASQYESLKKENFFSSSVQHIQNRIGANYEKQIQST